MAIIATGSKTIIDLSDGKSLSVYLGANQPRTQINDVNKNTFQPDWTTTAGKLVITPVVYANQTAISLSDSNLTITWKRKDGSSAEANLVTASEKVSGNILTVNKNNLSSTTSKQLTYIAQVAYLDKDTGVTINATADITFALLTTGEDAKNAWISGEQVFKINADGTRSPEQITLTANLQNVTVSKWQYKDSEGNWQDYPTTNENANITSPTLNITPDHAVFVGRMASIRVLTSDNEIIDTTSVCKVEDGAVGGSAPTVFLTNESILFPADKDGRVLSSTNYTCNVVAYLGTTKVTPTIGTITGHQTVSGMQITVQDVSDNEIPIKINISYTSNMGTLSKQSKGVITIPVTYPVSTKLYINWAKISTGDSGISPTVFNIYSSSGGTVFTNGKAAGGDSSITLQVKFVYNNTEYTSVSTAYYTWEKYISGTWETLQAKKTGTQKGYICIVKPDDVLGTTTIRCTGYGPSTGTYTDTITIEDKTDNYQVEIDSTAGNVFKNTEGQTCLICRVWQQGSEVDAQKCTNFSETAPTSPATGECYYKITPTSPTVALMRYDGSAWADVSSDATYGHEYTYNWYRRDSDGNPLDSGNVFATGKVIYIDDEDVDGKTVFVCEVFTE